uniref:Putative conserved secreted protein n=1 Tax=Lutzomyia longipalpis TaxID=7200 RepID=A0A1B0CH81_LUTLO
MLEIQYCVVLLSFFVTCNGFWWSSQNQEPTLKQYPIGYFRTYTYHPFTLSAAPFSPNYIAPQRLSPTAGYYQAKQFSTAAPQAPVLPPQTSPQPVNDYSPPPQPTNPPPPPPQPQPQPLLSRPNSYNNQDGFSYQYVPPAAPYNVQQVQFVPCMCPVTVSVGTDLPAEKRSDDINATDPPSEQPPADSKLNR